MVTLLALVGLTALAVGGFLLSDTDFRVTENHEAGVRAFYAADAGLQQYMGTHRGIPNDTQTFSFATGSAEVYATPLNQLDSMLVEYLITSRSTYMTPKGGVTARSVHAVGLLNTLTLAVPAAFSSPVGILKNGGAGELSGWDASSGSDCSVGGQPGKPGVAVPPGGYVQNGGNSVPEGNPPILEDDPLDILASTMVDWQGIVDGSALTPDYSIPPDTWPDFGTEVGPDEWPNIYSSSALFNVSPGNSGRGILITRHDLTMSGNFTWDGIILVGGTITSNGNQTIQGGVITGLNLLLNESVPDNDLGNGTKSFRYHSCNVAAAMAQLATFVEEPGSWFETY